VAEGIAGFASIAAASNHAAFAIDYHRSDRDFTVGRSLFGERQGFVHPLRCVHGSKMVHPARLELATF
jgi:hypothetical protein